MNLFFLSKLTFRWFLFLFALTPQSQEKSAVVSSWSDLKKVSPMKWMMMTKATIHNRFRNRSILLHNKEIFTNVTPIINWFLMSFKCQMCNININRTDSKLFIMLKLVCKILLINNIWQDTSRYQNFTQDESDDKVIDVMLENHCEIDVHSLSLHFIFLIVIHMKRGISVALNTTELLFYHLRLKTWQNQEKFRFWILQICVFPMYQETIDGT